MQRLEVGGPVRPIYASLGFKWLIYIFRKWDAAAWTGSSRPRIGTGDGNLLMQERTFGFHKMRGIS